MSFGQVSSALLGQYLDYARKDWRRFSGEGLQAKVVGKRYRHRRHHLQNLSGP